jgi:alkanesulfonate monooxygenase SsuD/methylene tetrahydromethanopterin reductase-like flavin-dependent oxidoreductase (luciferase family)
MIEIGVFHNGASDLPVLRTPSGVCINQGNLAEVHESSQRTLVSQIRQGILADKLGFNYFFMTEHHFQPEGAEFSPSPLLAETAIAARTKQIRLGQAANIVTWWHPVRIAEQAAMLDVLSGGRLEFGIGRGYQPREAEVFGWPFATIQDQERNRAYYQEAYDIILKCWTQPSFSHHGQFFTIPPVFTRWNHQQTIAYFSTGTAGRKLEDVLQIGSPDPYGGPNPVMQSSTLLKELQVFPQPLQRPHPQMWEPLTTERSIKWAAERGLNGYFIVEPNSRLKKNLDFYYETSERAGWPDRLGRGRLKYGWDSEKRRGVLTGRYIHLLLPGMDRQRELNRFREGLELQWDYYGPFGFAAVLADADEEKLALDKKVDANTLLKKEIAIFGTAAEVTAAIMRIKESCGYQDFAFNTWFETGGFSSAEVEDQMQYFAAEVKPQLARACGGQVQNPQLGLNFE